MVPVSKPVVKELFRRLRKEEVMNISQDLAKDAVYNIALFMKGQGKLDAESFVSWFLSRMKNCSEIIENKENYTKTYIIKHDWERIGQCMTRQYWSQFLQSIYKSQYKSI